MDRPDRGRDEWRHPDWYAGSEGEIKDVTEAEEEGEADNGACSSL
jgi:hypothetical protein